VRSILPPLAIALLYQGLLTFFTSFFTGPEGAYGAPLPVGQSCGFCIISLGGGSETFSWAVFLLNLLLTAAVVWGVGRLGGHLVAAAIGGVVLFALALVMYFSLRQGLPFAGIPVPIALRDPLVDAPRIALLALWIDIMAGTLLFSLPSILRNRAPRGQITSRRPETGR
jgi:hypothetical protein